MNVVVVNDNAHVNGGAAKLAIIEACGLAEKGHNVFFFSALAPTDERLAQHERIEVICTEQYDLLSNPNRLDAFKQGLWNSVALRRLRELLATLDPEDTVIHLHVWSRGLSASVVSGALHAGLPTVCTLHDFLVACPTGTFFLHRQQAICHLKPMSAACIGTNCDTRSYGQKLWRVGRQFLQNQVVQIPARLKHYIVHSSLASDVMRPFLSEDAHLHHVTAYIESQHQPPAAPDEYDRFCYIGRLVNEKGVSMLARSAAAEQVPVVFVGSGALETEIRALNPDAEVTGWVDYAASLSHLRRSRALVFPSLWYETLGLVVLEAAANGIPSIVPDTSAARELVEDGVTGLHFRSGDEDDLRSKLRMLRDPQLAARLGHAAYARFWASSYGHLEPHIASLEEIYHKMLDGHRSELRQGSLTFAGGAA